MLACVGDFHEFHGQYMENDSSPLPYEVASVSNNIRDFCTESGEVKRVGNYFIGKAELGEGMFAKVKKGIHALTGEQVRLRDGGVADIRFSVLKCLLPVSFVYRWPSRSLTRGKTQMITL